PAPATSFMRSRLISTTSASPRRSIAIRVVSSGTALNTTVLYFGLPRRQWDGTASSLTWEPETCSTNREGPDPTGARAKPSSPLASPYRFGRNTPCDRRTRDGTAGPTAVV